MSEKYLEQNKKLKVLQVWQIRKIFEQFRSKIHNHTYLEFTQNENLLSKGLKYNLYYTPNNWIRTLVIKARTAKIRRKSEQTYLRHATIYIQHTKPMSIYKSNQ
jgi:hypothetical protein